MGKEAKIGLGVIAILAIVLGVVVFRKVWGSKDLPDAAVGTPAVDSGASGDGKSELGGATLIPASGGENAADSHPLGSDVDGPRQWVGATDQFNPRQDGGSSGQPPAELMPKTGSSFDSGRQNTLRSGSPSGDRFGDPGLRQREDFGAGRRNRLRPDANDGALNPSSRRQYSDRGLQPTDPNLGGRHPATPAQLQPGPDAIQIAAPSASTQAQYAAQQQPAHGTQGSAGYGAAKTQTQYGTYGSPYTTGALPYASRSDAIAGDGIAGQGGFSKNTGSYVVGPNDSFWLVSKKAYGTGDFYKALIEHNRQKFPDPSKIRVGDVIATPAVASLRKNYPVFCPKERTATNNPYRTTALGAVQSRGQRVYVVQEGDTIFNIARDELGKSARWSDICALNRDLLGDDYDHLKPGWKLVLPRSGAATSPAVGAERQDSLTRKLWSRIE